MYEPIILVSIVLALLVTEAEILPSTLSVAEVPGSIKLSPSFILMTLLPIRLITGGVLSRTVIVLVLGLALFPELSFTL